MSRDASASAARGPRRSQQERREATQRLLLDATLRTLGARGYAGTSIGEVLKTAGLSRGAVSHHYPTKLDLVAAAITHFYEQRFSRLEQGLILEQGRALTLQERLRIFREDVDEWSPIGFEIMVAVRTDPQLKIEYERRVAPRSAEMVATYERMFPEFGKLKSPELMIGVVGAFLRGLTLEDQDGGSDRSDKLFTLFADMVLKATEQES